MRKSKSFLILPISLGAGCVGLILRLILLSAVDEKGLLKARHPLSLLVWVLTGAVLITLFLLTRSLSGKVRYSRLFPPSVLGAVGSLAVGLGILFTALQELRTMTDMLALAAAVFGFAAGGCMLYLAYCRWQGLRPSVYLRILVTVYFVLHLVCQYRMWSAEPQLQSYCFQLLASVCLMLTSFHRAAFDGKMGRRSSLVFYSNAALYFCCLSLAGEKSRLFYLACLVWLAADSCSLAPPPHRQETQCGEGA